MYILNNYKILCKPKLVEISLYLLIIYYILIINKGINHLYIVHKYLLIF